MRALALAAVILVALLAVPSLLGVERFAITGGSMGSAVPVGSLVFTKPVAATAVRPGDVVTFRPPGLAETVTHRVVSTDPDGIRTRGDANAAADPWRLGAGVPLRRVVAHVPAAGYAAAALRGPAIAGLAALLLALVLLRGAAADLKRKAVTA
jgi:signal peptidase I